MAEQASSSVGLFNYAHSYAVSARTLEMSELDVTHSNTPIYFLYFHAIELFLKSFLVAKGHDPEDLRKAFGHRVRLLADKGQEYGLDFTDKDEEALTLLDTTDNVISARYIRVGLHKRLPLSVFDVLCRSLYVQVRPAAYENVGGARYPEAWW